MLPLIIDPAKLAVIVMGDGPATVRRMQMLDAANVEYEHIPEDTIAASTLDRAGILFVADFDDATSARLYREAKAANCLVNVEDKKAYCDFHVPAIVRRGDLLFTVSTGAASPRLARRLRMMLETLFPPQWSDWLETIRQKRDQWKAEGASFAELVEKTDALLDENGWLQKDCAYVRASTQSGTVLGQQTTAQAEGNAGSN